MPNKINISHFLIGRINGIILVRLMSMSVLPLTTYNNN